MIRSALLTLLVLAASSVAAQEVATGLRPQPEQELISWEPDDLPVHQVSLAQGKSLVFPLTNVSLALVRMYQKKISPNSVLHRCPFKTSCSAFAYESIQANGIIKGLVMFIDRYYFRENPGTPFQYPLHEGQQGILKLNDDFYLWQGQR